MKPGAKNSAEGSEVRKASSTGPKSQQRRGVAGIAGMAEKCGKSAEEIRNLSCSTLSALPTNPARPRRAPSLASTKPKSRANVSPHPAHRPGGDVLTTNDRSTWPEHELAVIEAALAIVRARMRMGGEGLTGVDAARELAVLHMAGLDRERFSVMFLNAQNQLLAIEDLFDGTLTQTSVYPREVARAALRHNAGAVILMHNHPSGSCEPSQADKDLTAVMRSSLQLLDVRVLDHFVVGHAGAVSFAERGLM